MASDVGCFDPLLEDELKKIPETEDSLVLRTDFSNDELWEEVCKAIEKPDGISRAYVEFLSNSQYENLNIEQLLSLIGEESNHTFLFIVDKKTLSLPEFPILCIDLFEEPGRSFRVIPSAMISVQNNLSIANMDFEEFAESVDPDGIFRGF